MAKASAGIKRLEFWLNEPFWDFATPSDDLGEFSEGVFLLSGIDPRESYSFDADFRGISLLPGTLKQYGKNKHPSSESQRYGLFKNIEMELECVSAMVPRVRHHPREVVGLCRELKISIPWLDPDTANSISRNLLPKNAVRDRVRGRIDIARSKAKGGNAYAEGNDTSKIIRGAAKASFDDIAIGGFQNCMGNRSTDILLTKVRDRVLEALRDQFGDDPSIPTERTVYENVRTWYKSYKSEKM